MANIRIRGNSATIQVSNGFDSAGERIRPNMTIEREPGMTDKQWERHIQKTAIEFEERVKKGVYLDGNKITLAEFVDLWRTKYAQKELQPKTLFEYERHIARITKAMGHLKIGKIQPLHILEFYNNLAEQGVREDNLYRANKKFTQYLKDNNINGTMLAELTATNVKTSRKLINGENTNKEKASQVCERLDISLKDYFEVVKQAGGVLSERTIQHHHRTLSAILQKAVEWQVIYENPARRVTAPKVTEKDMRYFEEDEILRLFEILQQEHIKHQAWIYIAAYIGCRLGELGGLRWEDVNFNENLISIHQASQTLPGKGIFIKDPKNESSKRTVSASPAAMRILKEYQIWQKEQRLAMGELWVDSGFIFTKVNGEIMNPNTPTQWFLSFRRRNNLPDVNFHGLRHTNAAILIGEGVDIQTVGGRLGHAKPTTTGKVYSHFLKKPDEKASQKLEEKFNGKKEKDGGQVVN
ncbi:MAG: site-specific integrase [Eubacteriales bacterium]|nr:site-specific integrase [Eubacteriales bacterium]MDD4475938.1 site-specific integrase [Eubacteriales bacterium]